MEAPTIGEGEGIAVEFVVVFDAVAAMAEALTTLGKGMLLFSVK